MLLGKVILAPWRHLLAEADGQAALAAELPELGARTAGP